MEYVYFGNSGLKVSRMALGLGLRNQHDEAQVERLVHRALDKGVNLFDCANVYGLGDDRASAGTSERILGRALKGKRDDVVITSKVNQPVGNGVNDARASRYHIMREVERSLQRLDTDRIDVYLLHVFDAATPLEEQFRALEDLVHQGKIRYVGVCNYQAWQVSQALGVQERINASKLITAQNQYNLLDREIERELFPFARATGVGIRAYGPLAIGLLSGKHRPGATPAPGTLLDRNGADRIAAALNGQAGQVILKAFEVAERTGATVAQVAQQWVMTHPEISVVIAGANNAEQLDESLASVDLKLSDEDIAALTQVSEGMNIAPW